MLVLTVVSHIIFIIISFVLADLTLIRLQMLQKWPDNKNLCGYLSRSKGTLQRSLILRQIGVNSCHPGQRGVVPVKMRLLLRWVEEPALVEEMILQQC